jgi:hypothetical protein
MTPYPNARSVSQRVLQHLEQHAAAPFVSKRPAATLPSAEVIEAMVEAGFWASLRREEGRTPLLSLAFVSASQAPRALMFEHGVNLAPEPLTRVGPAVERPGIHLGVWKDNGELRVWGATRILPHHCFVVEVIAPGFLILKQSPGDDSGKFVNIAVLQGDDIKIVDQTAARTPDCPDLLTSLLGFESQHAAAASVNVLIQLAVSMRAHGRGGTLLVTPVASETWRESMVRPITYAVSPPFSVLADLMDADEDARTERSWQDSLRRAVDAVAGLTAVDGATVVTDRYALLAFGAKIVRRPKWPLVTGIIVTEPIEGSSTAIIEPAQFGGTRHLSAAQFAHDQTDAIALVASQDGRFTVFAWSPCEQMVHAHRIEALLL